MNITPLNPQNQQFANAQQQTSVSAQTGASTQVRYAGLSSGLSSTTVYQGSQLGQGYGDSIYQSPYYGYTQSTYTEPDIALRKVENGWILKMKGKEYILNGTDKVEKYLKLFLE